MVNLLIASKDGRKQFDNNTGDVVDMSESHPDGATISGTNKIPTKDTNAVFTTEGRKSHLNENSLERLLLHPTLRASASSTQECQTEMPLASTFNDMSRGKVPASTTFVVPTSSSSFGVNYRSTYYQTLGVVEILERLETQEIFDRLMHPTDDIVPVHQLIQRTIQHGVPSTYRARVWQLACDLLSVYQEVWPFVQTERERTFEDVWEVIQTFLYPKKMESNPHHRLVSPLDLVQIFNIYQLEILGRESLQLMAYPQLLLRVAQCCQEVHQENLADQFWCFNEFIDVLEQGMGNIQPVILPEDLYHISIEELEVIIFRVIESTLPSSL